MRRNRSTGQSLRALQAAAVRIVSVATGGNHTLAVGACGSVWACGRGRHGQLGLGHFRDAGSMTLCEALRGVRVMSAAAGQAHSLVMTDSGDVRADARPALRKRRTLSSCACSRGRRSCSRSA